MTGRLFRVRAARTMVRRPVAGHPDPDAEMGWDETGCRDGKVEFGLVVPFSEVAS